jgi:hypothetical protein
MIDVKGMSGGGDAGIGEGEVVATLGGNRTGTSVPSVKASIKVFGVVSISRDAISD